MDRMFWIPAIAGSIFLVYVFAWTLIHIGSQFDKSLEEKDLHERRNKTSADKRP